MTDTETEAQKDYGTYSESEGWHLLQMGDKLLQNMVVI